MKTIIAGSREITDVPYVMGAIDNALDELANGHGLTITEVFSGCARGVDKIGEVWAKQNGVPVRRFPADWERFRKAAGIVRNEEMGLEAEYLIAVWDGESRGTKHMINVMQRQGKLVTIIDAPSLPKFRRVRRYGQKT